jgi:hypothetical protein
MRVAPTNFAEVAHDFALPDLLPEAARLTREWAHALCVPSQVRHEGCADYHAAWTTLRLIGAITGARTDKDFFHAQFTQLAINKPNARVLIAGTADHAVLHMLLEAFSATGAHPEVTIVDSCATTLSLNQWYAQQVGAKVTCVQVDLREINLPNRFDLITTHSVFSFMSMAEVTSALCSWRNHLAEGGGLKFVQAIRPELEERSRMVFDKVEEADFVVRAEQRWAERGPFPGLELGVVRRLAQKFAHHKRGYVVTSAQQILDASSAAGLVVREATEVDRHQLGYRSSAPAAIDRAFSLRVVAQSR